MMTVTSAHAGMSATRRRRRIRATVAAAAVAVALTALTGAPASAATPSPSPTSSGELVATLAAAGSGVVEAGGTLTATLSVDNGTLSASPAATATLLLGDQALGDRSALSAWLDGSGSVPTGGAIGTAEVGAVVAGGTGTAGFAVSAADSRLSGRAAGVYPLWATVGALTARTVVTVSAGDAAAVGIVVPLTAGPLQTGLLTAARLADLTADGGSLSAQLDAVTGTSAILAIDPAVPAAIRVLGTSAPASAQAWLTRLENLPNSRFALQFGDADVSAQLDAGLAAPLQPTSFTSYLDPADFPAQPHPSATSADGGGQAALPDTAALLDVGDVAGTLYWPPTGTTSTSVVDALAASDPGATTLVASTSTQAGASGETVTANGTTAVGSPVLVYDAAVSAALGEAAAEAETTPRNAALATASAYLSFARAGAGGAPLLVVVDRTGTAAQPGLRAAIATIAQAAGVTAIGLGELLGASGAEVALVDAAADGDRVGAVVALGADAERIGRFATILDDAELLTGPERAAMLQLLGGAWLSQPSAWQQALTAHGEQTEQTLSSVSIVPPTSINLLTAGTDLKFWVHNALPYAVNVVLYATPDDLRLSVDRENAVTAAAATTAGASNTAVEIPVRARIANGEVRIMLTLRSPTREPIGAAQVVEVNVRADWERAGVVVMVVLIGGFLTIGVIRTVRRRRADRRRAEG